MTELSPEKEFLLEQVCRKADTINPELLRDEFKICYRKYLEAIEGFYHYHNIAIGYEQIIDDHEELIKELQMRPTLTEFAAIGALIGVGMAIALVIIAVIQNGGLY